MRVVACVGVAVVLSLSAVSLADEPATMATQPSSQHSHRGFFLNMETGVAYLFANESTTPFPSRASGVAWESGVSIGGSMGENDLLGGHLFGTLTFYPDTSYAEGAQGGPKSFGVYGIGPQYTHYFMPLNLYVSGAVLLTRATIEGGGGTASTDPGAGLKLSLGKEWWLGRHWGLGIAALFVYSWNHDLAPKDNCALHYDPVSGEGSGTGVFGCNTMTAGYFALDFSATYN
jgi:hypothetical protein